MLFVLALLPILSVLGLMILRHWGAHKAGPAGWLVGLVLAGGWFGLTPQVLWVSQVKGVLLSVFVLAVLWPALFLYYWIDQNGGITAIAHALSRAMPERGMCLVLLAWALSGFLEGLAGFGLPIAVVAPMLIALGVTPVLAIAAVAVGHSWAVTFGDMGVIFQTLVAVVGLPGPSLVPLAALLLGLACLFCGLATALLLGQLRHGWKISGLAAIMGITQYLLAELGLIPLAGLAAGLAGLFTYIVASRYFGRTPPPNLSATLAPEAPTLTSSAADSVPANHPGLGLAVATYGGLVALMGFLFLVPLARHYAGRWVWQPTFAEVITRTGFVTAKAFGPAFRPGLHPGPLMLLVTISSILLWRIRVGAPTGWQRAARATARSATMASFGILFMVGLSTLMDHCGMSFQLARGLSEALGRFYPLLSPCVGILGAFATGSNNNSNVLFGPLQRDVASLLHLRPEALIAAQTAGGSLGSMLAPAKIVVGCSTVNATGQEGDVLRRTLPYGLLIGLALGIVTLLCSRP